ncbi:MAG: zinc ribbon domain-containing protein [Clostridiales bacterium]|nr:zinc ribbon domain-containing protein [Clostridiales bacterium]
MQICPKCRKQLRVDVKFCSQCGFHLYTPVYCSNCGKKMKSYYRFCLECGSVLHKLEGSKKPNAAKERQATEESETTAKLETKEESEATANPETTEHSEATAKPATTPEPVASLKPTATISSNAAPEFEYDSEPYDMMSGRIFQLVVMKLIWRLAQR